MSEGDGGGGREIDRKTIRTKSGNAKNVVVTNTNTISGVIDRPSSRTNRLPRAANSVSSESENVREFVIGGIFVGLILITLIGVYVFYCVVKPYLRRKVN